MEGTEKKVLLTIRGKQTDPEGNVQENLSVYEAVCREPVQESLSEFEAACREFFYQEEDQAARLYVSRSIVVMERAGGTRMVFDPLVPVTKCLYRTPYGTIPMEIRTRRIAVLFGSGSNQRRHDACGGLRVRVAYLLTMEGDILLECEVTIRAGMAT